jgi:methylated-DNA-[protein]-cysteine S-methyltransferase
VIEIRTVESPVGSLTLAVRRGRLCLLHFGSDVANVRATLERWYPDDTIGEGASDAVVEALERYFGGEITAIDAIDVEMNGTPFQRRVWAALREVRAGSTASYSEIARRIGAPAAVRAVGAANGANPVALVVPCHRIVGANGSLTGYGGGLDRKQWLLRHEGARRLF